MKLKYVKKISFIVLFAVIFSVLALNFLTVSADEGDEANPSGAYLKYTVNVNKKETDPRLAFHYITLRKLDYVIQEGDMLEYDVYIDIDEKGWGAIDGDISDVGIIRESGMSDTDGNGIHTGVDLSAYCFEQWWHRVIPFGITEDENEEKYTVGRTLKQIQLAMHPESDEDIYTGTVLYDNIVITNNGEVKLVIFRDEEDFMPDEIRYSHSQGLKKNDATVECLVFTDEEMQAFKDAKEAKIIEEASREAARIEAEELKQASIEQASIDASIAESEAANRTDAIDENPAADSGSSTDKDKDDDGKGINIWLIVCFGGAAVAVIIAVVIVAKKKGGNK